MQKRTVLHITLAVLALAVMPDISEAAPARPATANSAPADGPKLYRHPVTSAAFEGCEWQRIRTTSGPRWRANCPESQNVLAIGDTN